MTYHLRIPMKSKIFSFLYRISLSDTDASGVIYFPKIFDISLKVLEYFLESRNVPLQQFFQGGVLMPVVHTSANFYLPLCFGDPIQIDLLIDRLGVSSLSLKYLFLNKQGNLCAQANITHVTVSKNNQRESMVIPKELEAIFCSAL